MSKTLNLVDRLLAMGRLFQQMGRIQDALRVFGRLAGLRKLPASAAEETQARLAQLHLQQRHFKDARRHITAALQYQQKNAEYHYLMASAHDQDEDGDPLIALEHYRQACSLERKNPQYRADYGLLAICLGEDDQGLKALRKAVDLSPDDPEIVGSLLEGLCQLERPQEARLTLRAALFRNPRHSGFRKLWSDFRFQEIRQKQETARQREQSRRLRNDEPMILPFVRPSDSLPGSRGRKQFRLDPGSQPGAHGPHLNHISDQKHA